MRWALLFFAMTANAFGQVPPKRVATEDAERHLISAKPPTYPSFAQQTRISGVVIVEISIDTTGKTQIVRVISGHPMLVDAATRSVKSSLYRPFVENGNPTTVITAVMVTFGAVPSQIATAQKELGFQYAFWTTEGIAREALAKGDAQGAGVQLKKAEELLATVGLPGHRQERSQLDIDSSDLKKATERP